MGGVWDTGSLAVRPIVRGEVERFNSCLDEHHWLGRGLTGQVMRYVAEIGGCWVAVVGFGSAALSCAPRDRHIGWSRAQQYRRLRYVMNNQRFCVLPEGGRFPNLASAVLSRVLGRLSADCVIVHGHPVVGVETFTDPSRHRGTCYKAAGFTALGHTLGYRRSSGTYRHHGNPKVLWWRPLRRDAARILVADFDHRALGAPEDQGPMLDLEAIDFGSLRDHLQVHLGDWRMRRGIRHNHASLFTIAVAAALSGARNVVAIGEFARDLPQEALARLGARCKDGTHIAPHTDTFRRAFEGVDVEALDAAIGSWLRANLPTDAVGAVAVDGKTLRGAWTPNGTQVHLLAAMVHKEGVVLAQREVPPDTNEITQVRPLLEDLDLAGTVVTADALHAQRDHAEFLVGEKSADYVFCVKANQPSLRAAIEDRFDGPFSPSPPGD